MSIHVHFEGMDLSGKSTTAALLQAQMGEGWRVQHNRLVEHNPIADLADELLFGDDCDSEVLGRLYAVSIMHDIHRYRDQATEEHIIQDSLSLIKSIAYHAVRGSLGLVEELKGLLEEHPRFDASYYFSTTLDDRIERLRKRIADEPDSVNEDDLKILTDPSKFTDTEAILREVSVMSFGSKIIDTSSYTQPEVLSIIRADILDMEKYHEL